MVHIHTALPYILATFCLVHAEQTVPVKGVAPENYSQYAPLSSGKKDMWRCLDGSKVIPHTAINDDYCDCPDGSDEPGTSACPSSVFYCQNVGHKPAFIKSYAVNDGVCDEECCDGSDETSGLIQCPNRCPQVAAAYQASRALLAEAQAAGIAAKNKLIAQGAKRLEDWETEKAKLEEKLVISRAELIRRQSEIEQLEQEEAHVDPEESSACPPCTTSQKDMRNIIMLKDHINTLQGEMERLVILLGDMKRDHNHNYHDLAVKAAIAGYDAFISKYDELIGHINEEVSVMDDLYKVDLELNTVNKVIAEENAEEQHQKESVSIELEAARKAKDTLETDIRSMENNLRVINDNLSKDYGKDYEWLGLKDYCMEKNTGEYTYSLCLLGDAHQKSNKDGVRVSLGRFNKFLGDHGEEQVYKHGAKCWNGPERSVHVVFECGPETEIIDVTEPEKCEYKYKAKTPIVCTPIETPESLITGASQQKPQTVESTTVSHDEL